MDRPIQRTAGSFLGYNISSMEEIFVFTPSRRPGLFTHFGAMLVLSAVVVWSLWQAASVGVGRLFLVYLLLALLSVAALPLLGYRAYALWTGSYTLQRDGIHLRWGLRLQIIPMDAVLWVHPASELSAPVPLPWLRWSGALMGSRRLPGEGEVEFLAANPGKLLIIATQRRFYAISPEDPNAFLATYQRFTEMGSLDPLAAHAQHPTFLVAQVWHTPAARALLLAGVILCLVLFAWVSLMITTRPQVHMGFYPDGAPGALVPAAQLLLLPVLCTLFYVVDLFLGLFFFRRQNAQPLSYLLWGSGALAPSLSLAALYFISRAG